MDIQQQHNRKAKWINNMKKELHRIEEDLESGIHLESLKIIIKKVANWKAPDHDEIHGFWF